MTQMCFFFLFLRAKRKEKQNPTQIAPQGAIHYLLRPHESQEPPVLLRDLDENWSCKELKIFRQLQLLFHSLLHTLAESLLVYGLYVCHYLWFFFFFISNSLHM